MSLTVCHPLPLQILLAGPRGFCAGVDRAIQIVERAIEKYGAPVYVRHEIVHNRYVVEGLSEQEILAIDAQQDVANCSITEYCHEPGAEGTDGQMKLLRYNVTAPMEHEQTPVTTKPDPIVGNRG